MKVSYAFKSIYDNDNYLRGEIKDVVDYAVSSIEETNTTELRIYGEGRNKTIILIPNKMLAIIDVEDN